MEPTTILFDIGWVIIDETVQEKKLFDLLTNLLEENINTDINPVQFDSVIEQGIRAYAPSLFSYIIWDYAKPDIALYNKIKDEFYRFDSTPYCRIFNDIPNILEKLNKHFRLGYAANQKSSIRPWLEENKIAEYFEAQRVSEDTGYKKPDLRHFLTALEDIGSTPEETIMVGDRLDNDIFPANLLGITTVQHRVGRHISQQARTPDDIPSYVIENLPDLLLIEPIAKKLNSSG